MTLDSSPNNRNQIQQHKGKNGKLENGHLAYVRVDHLFRLSKLYVVTIRNPKALEGMAFYLTKNSFFQK